MDVPALDAVMFADPKDSVIDTVQAVGRALRRGPGTGKTATIIVPVLVAEGQDAELAAESSEFDVVWQVVRALRAHDERIAGQLDQARARLGQPGQDASPGAEETSGWLQVTGTPVTAAFTRAIQVRTIAAATSSWPQWHAALAAYHARYGHARVPQGYRTPGGLALGVWLGRQRQLHNAGQLPAGRAAALDALGVIWQPQEQAWASGLARATAYHAAHGDLNIPSGHVTAGGSVSGPGWRSAAANTGAAPWPRPKPPRWTHSGSAGTPPPTPHGSRARTGWLNTAPPAGTPRCRSPTPTPTATGWAPGCRASGSLTAAAICPPAGSAPWKHSASAGKPKTRPGKTASPTWPGSAASTATPASPPPGPTPATATGSAAGYRPSAAGAGAPEPPAPAADQRRNRCSRPARHDLGRHRPPPHHTT